MNYFTRESRKGDIKILGKATDNKICKACKRNFNQKNYHVCQTNNFGIHRLRHTCKFCYNEDRNRRRHMKLRFPKPKECQICREKKILYVDHCHDTHQHRGWLCQSCNAALGHFKDSIEGLNEAVKYLERNEVE